MALRRLRRFAREGAPEILDMDGTIRSTAKNAGWLELRMIAPRHNAVKDLPFLEGGGPTEEHGRDWLQRLLGSWPRAAWLNPVPEEHWTWTTSILNVQRLMENRMYPVTIAGLASAMKSLA